MIWDCILFCNELDLLEIRLHTLAPYVDQFLLAESLVTFTGRDKPLVFTEHRARFAQFPIDVVVPPPGGRSRYTGHRRGEPWQREYFQREFLLRTALSEAAATDTILLSDVDEIPALDGWDPADGSFSQRLHYYALNLSTGRRWRGTMASRADRLLDPKSFRDRRNREPLIGGGWHFSWCMPPEEMAQKVASFSHTELDNDTWKRDVLIHRAQMREPSGRGRVYLREPKGMPWLLAHRDRYPHLWYGGTDAVQAAAPGA